MKATTLFPIIAVLSLITVEYGGWALLGFLTGQGRLGPFREQFFRAGHAHAGVLLPAELSPTGQRRLRLRMRVGGSSRGAAGAVSGRGLAFDDLLEYQWEASLGGEAMSREDFERLARMKRPLVQWRGQWVVPATHAVWVPPHVFVNTA